ncbi:MAG TPA: MmcQ/YjbR family DNA-binding protein [Pseudonocardiaceae bacterium]|nr:MmcQ/YjbR family DNA-binding protein [Pseudonocardiaceae bacterium]
MPAGAGDAELSVAAASLGSGLTVGRLASEGCSWGGMLPEYADVPLAIVAGLRSVCLGLPEAYEEPAWVGTRWRVRKRTFAHVLAVDPEGPPAYARASSTDGPVIVLTFRSPVDELDALVAGGRPFFKVSWGADVLGMTLDEGADWEEVAELLTESYCLLAPKKLAALVDRPLG